jgi:hypothetical protein
MNIVTFEGAKFQGVLETQKITGLSKATLYGGAKTGAFPHIRSGNRILFNIPRLLAVLDEQSTSKEGC